VYKEGVPVICISRIELPAFTKVFETVEVLPEVAVKFPMFGFEPVFLKNVVLRVLR
jgi:hypothetical protein